MIAKVFRKFRFLALRGGLGNEREFAHLALPGVSVDSEIRQSMLELQTSYSHYVTEVSSPGMAISLELAAFMVVFCRHRKPMRVLDLGSGFSSSVLRIYARELPGVEVYSVDDNAGWLEKTQEFVKMRNLRDDNFLTLQEFRQLNPPGFDFVLLDMAFVEERINHVDWAWSLTARGGVLILDDVHKPDYLFSVLSKFRSSKVKLYSLESLVKDQFGRFALAAVRS